jgi:hypothetical protein
MQVANQAQLGHYNANVNALKTGYDMQMEQFKTKPLGFGDALKRFAFAGIGNRMGAGGFGQMFKRGLGIPGLGGGFKKGLVY